MNRFALLLGATALLATTSACRVDEEEAPVKAAPVVESPPLPVGTFDVQSLSYDDASGLYSLFLVGTPAETKPLYQTQNLRMARMTDEEVAAGKQPYLVVDSEGPVAMLRPDTEIAFTHNVVEDRAGEPVVVRQESSTWSPFMAGMTGAMIGNMLFAPRFYYPPPYAGGRLAGFGGVGASRELAGRDFAGKNGALPQSTRLSKSGYSKSPSSAIKPSGSGAGSSKLRPTTRPSTRPVGKPFGGGRGFGGRRR
jgi:hypothetical protein